MLDPRAHAADVHGVKRLTRNTIHWLPIVSSSEWRTSLRRPLVDFSSGMTSRWPKTMPAPRLQQALLPGRPPPSPPPTKAKKRRKRHHEDRGSPLPEFRSKESRLRGVSRRAQEDADSEDLAMAEDPLHHLFGMPSTAQKFSPPRGTPIRAMASPPAELTPPPTVLSTSNAIEVFSKHWP